MPLGALFKRLTTLDSSSTDVSATADPVNGSNPAKCPATASSASALFPPPTSAEREAAANDPDCNHDCSACPDYPRSFQKIGIDTDDKMWGHIKGWATHAIVATGKTDWIRSVEDIDGSLMMALDKEVSARSSILDKIIGKRDNTEEEKGGKKKKTPGRLMISASNLPLPDDHEHHETDEKNRKTTVVLLPRFVVAEGVAPQDAGAILDYLYDGPSNSDPLLPGVSATTKDTSSKSPSSPDAKPTESTAEPVETEAADSSALTTTPSTEAATALPAHITVRPYPHSALILLCSHRHRDARCGISAPILKKEFERHLRPLGLWRDHTDQRPGGVSVVFINHVGGHKYSANCIIYRKFEGDEKTKEGGEGEAAQGIWMARVAPKDVPDIVRWTIKEGKVVDPENMLRGGFDRVRGLVSW